MLNTSGTRTTVLTLDHDNAEQHVAISTTGAFDPAAATGAFVSETFTETVLTQTWASASQTDTLSTAVTLATKTTEAQTKLDALVATNAMKPACNVAGSFAGAAKAYRLISPVIGEGFNLAVQTLLGRPCNCRLPAPISRSLDGQNQGAVGTL